MPSLVPNIENRVRKLPKPSTFAQGLQPLFEAVSNALYAIEDLFEDDAGAKGQVHIDLVNLSDEQKLNIEVRDNGIGLDPSRFEAFGTIDTDFKRRKGGKGVGRLFWLDAFSSVKVTSAYAVNGSLEHRAFDFRLANEEQIVPLDLKTHATRLSEPGTIVSFKGLRVPSYRENFPKRSDTFHRYFSAHFIADFLIGGGPRVLVSIDGGTVEYPTAVSELVVGEVMDAGNFETEDFGELSLTAFACMPEASTGLDGNHQLHLLANGRTVETRKIDGLLGLATISNGAVDGLYFHACLAGEYLDDRVNEGRTAFNIPEKVLKNLTRQCVDHAKEALLGEQIEKYSEGRRRSFENFLSRHPIYGFEDIEVALDRVPFNATSPEEFASGLVKFQIRRDEARQDAMESVIRTLDGADDVPENFAEFVIEAAENLQEAERLSLAQHVVRRKLVLELLEKLVRRIRQREGREDDFHLEKTLHSFICPMGVRGDDPVDLHGRAHDLWIVDERLSFARAFSSDKRLDQVLKEGGTGVRPDLFVWDLAMGMGVVDPDKDTESVDLSEPLKKVLIIEFKKPGRRDYAKAEDNIAGQLTKYLAQLKGGEIETFGRERVRIANDCVFYCYVVADIVGDLKDQLSAWATTANGEGRIFPLQNEYRGSIEVVQWQDLINDAWSRNQAVMHAAGLRRR